MTDKKTNLPKSCGPFCSITSLSTAPDQCVSFCLAQRCPELIQQLLSMAAKYPTGSFFLSQRPDIPLDLRQITVFCVQESVSALPEIWKLVVSFHDKPLFQFFKSGSKAVDRDLKDISDLLPVSNEICKSFEAIPKTKTVHLTFRLYFEAPNEFKGSLEKTGNLVFKHVSMGTILTLKNVSVVAVSNKNVIIERTFLLSPNI
jgi:hypothetical protein